MPASRRPACDVCSILHSALLGFAGIHDDKKMGIQQVEIAADHGHYLRPFTKIFLALAALCDKKAGCCQCVARRTRRENRFLSVALAEIKVSPTAITPEMN